MHLAPAIAAPPPPAVRQARARDVLGALRDDDALPNKLRNLLAEPCFALPPPAGGATLARWQTLADVASHDLSLAKLYEGHTDALAILLELKQPPDARGSDDATWAVWAAESPGGRVILSPAGQGLATLHGHKHWCSGADSVSHALLTAWTPEGTGPYLVRVALDQAGIARDAGQWHAVGMQASNSLELHFNAAVGCVVGERGDYVTRPGFMHGGAGIAACWYGGAAALAAHLRDALVAENDVSRAAFRFAALGKVDMALKHTAALLREAARWIDQHPRDDATVAAVRVRQSADACARSVLEEVGRALGATPFCRNAHFARLAADLPVFTRQNLAERDFLVLGERLAHAESVDWRLEPES